MRNIRVIDFTHGKRDSKDVDTNIPFEKNYNEAKTIQQANVVIASYLNKNLKDINKVLSSVYLYNSDIKYLDIIKEYNLNKIIFIKDEEKYYILSSISESEITFTELTQNQDLYNINIIKLSSLDVWSKDIINTQIADSDNNGLMSKEYYDLLMFIDENVTDLNESVSKLGTNKQDKLYDSGVNQNIKTINGESVLGSDNIIIEKRKVLFSGNKVTGNIQLNQSASDFDYLEITYGNVSKLIKKVPAITDKSIEVSDHYIEDGILYVYHNEYTLNDDLLQISGSYRVNITSSGAQIVTNANQLGVWEVVGIKSTTEQ